MERSISAGRVAGVPSRILVVRRWSQGFGGGNTLWELRDLPPEARKILALLVHILLFVPQKQRISKGFGDLKSPKFSPAAGQKSLHVTTLKSKLIRPPYPKFRGYQYIPETLLDRYGLHMLL